METLGDIYSLFKHDLIKLLLKFVCATCIWQKSPNQPLERLFELQARKSDDSTSSACWNIRTSLAFFRATSKISKKQSTVDLFSSMFCIEMTVSTILQKTFFYKKDRSLYWQGKQSHVANTTEKEQKVCWGHEYRVTKLLKINIRLFFSNMAKRLRSTQQEHLSTFLPF